MSGLLKDGLYYVYAEYNPFWAYMGWWLYAIAVEELTDNRDIETWAQPSWLNYDWRLRALFRDIKLPGYEKVSDRLNQYDYCRDFFRKYPAGLVCKIREDGHQFIPQGDWLGDYQRIVRERQLLHIAKAQERR
jgi:hypothetical protein